MCTTPRKTVIINHAEIIAIVHLPLPDIHAKRDRENKTMPHLTEIKQIWPLRRSVIFLFRTPQVLLRFLFFPDLVRFNIRIIISIVVFVVSLIAAIVITYDRVEALRYRVSQISWLEVPLRPDADASARL